MARSAKSLGAGVANGGVLSGRLVAGAAWRGEGQFRDNVVSKRLSKNGGTVERAAQVAKACEHACDATLRSPLRSPTVRGNGVSRWSAAGSMTREAMLLLCCFSTQSTS